MYSLAVLRDGRKERELTRPNPELSRAGHRQLLPRDRPPQVHPVRRWTHRVPLRLRRGQLLLL
jgi:hypothetical protein